MKIENIEGMRIQTADAGHVLVNGESYSDKVHLGEGAAPWDEIEAPADLFTDPGKYILKDGVFVENEIPKIDTK